MTQTQPFLSVFLGRWGQCLHPRGSKKEVAAGRQGKKKKWRETLVMDKPVVSVGEPGDEGVVVGVGR